MLPHNYKTNKDKYDLLEVVVLDYKGPMKNASLKGDTLGYVVFVDLASSFSQVFPILRKSEILEKFKIFESFSERTTAKKIKCIRSDGAGEYKYGSFADYLYSKGIRQEFSPAYAHSSNGTAESRIRILGSMARSMLLYANLSNSFTHLAIMCANYIYNRAVCKHTKVKTPYECFTGHKPRIDYFRIFGCKAYYHVHKEKRKNDYNLRAKIGRMVGYSSYSNTYKIWNGKSIIETKDVIFDETSFVFSYTDHKPDVIETDNAEIEDLEQDSIYISIPATIPKPANHDSSNSETNIANTFTPAHTVPISSEQSNAYSGVPIASLINNSDSIVDVFHEMPFFLSDQSASETSSSINTFTTNPPIRDTGLNGVAWQNNLPTIEGRLTRAQARLLANRNRIQNQPDHLDTNQTYLTIDTLSEAAVLYIDKIPNNFKEALSSQESDGWKGSINRELQSLEELRTFVPVLKSKLPANTKIYKTRYVFTRKPAPILYERRFGKKIS
jgi:hypothetical protein